MSKIPYNQYCNMVNYYNYLNYNNYIREKKNKKYTTNELEKEFEDTVNKNKNIYNKVDEISNTIDSTELIQNNSELETSDNNSELEISDNNSELEISDDNSELEINEDKKNIYIDSSENKFNKKNIFSNLQGSEDKSSKNKEQNDLHILSRMNLQQRLNYLVSLKTVHIFKNTHNYSEDVRLLDKNVVVKKLKMNSLGQFLFKSEVSALIRLLGFKHFPQILAYNINNLTIYMTYCGEVINHNNIPDNWSEQFTEIYNTLKENGINSDDMIERNICVKDNIISIIDFGLCNNYSQGINESSSKLYHLLEYLYKKKNYNYNYNGFNRY